MYEECSHLVDFTFSPNGSNETVMRFTPFKLANLIFLMMAEITPADLFHVPFGTIDIFVVLAPDK